MNHLRVHGSLEIGIDFQEIFQRFRVLHPLEHATFRT